MAKMGYKSGEGLGRDNQGMSMALQVEKTSKRGGKIIHERDIPKGLLVAQLILNRSCSYPKSYTCSHAALVYYTLDDS